MNFSTFLIPTTLPHLTTVHHELQQAGIGIDKLKQIAWEWNDEKCVEEIYQITPYSPEELGFLDKTLKNEWTLGRHYERLQEGICAQKQQVFVRGWQTSMEALLSLDGIVASTIWKAQLHCWK